MRLIPPHLLPPDVRPAPVGTTESAAAPASISVFQIDLPLRQKIIKALSTDPIAAAHRQDPNPNQPNQSSQSSRSTRSNQFNQSPWSWEDGLLLYNNLIYVPQDDSIRLELLRQHHDSPLAGHYGYAKTLELLSRNYYYPGMYNHVKSYVTTCDACALGKAPRHLQHGELSPLPVPSGPWKSISCDFVVDLPLSNGYDSLLVFVDRFTKMIHLVPCLKTTDAPGFARMYLDHVVRLHGIQDSLVSDRGSIFTSHFWSSLSNMMNMKQKLSTAYHPQTDGQTERMNQTIEQYLRIFCNYLQDNWSSLLSLAEFSYNNAHQPSINCSPFYANYGYNPSFTIDLRKPSTNITVAPAAKDHAGVLRNLHEQLIENLKSAQNHQAKYYDAKHKRIEFTVGNKVWLLSPNVRTERPSKKLDWKRLGPFPITKRIGTQAYKLELPSSMRIHPVFHVSLLDPHKPSTIPGRTNPPPPPVVVDDKQEFEIEQILDSEVKRKHLYYLIKWKGYPISDNSWQPVENVKNAPQLVESFHLKYPTKPSSSRPTRRTRSSRPNRQRV